MARNPATRQAFNVVIVGQSGRLMYEAVLFAASLRQMSPGLDGLLFVAVPRPGPLWPDDPGISNDDVTALLGELGAELLPFDSHAFGAAYPYGKAGLFQSVMVQEWNKVLG